jgi:RNA methyltransferase, TrmH family
MTRISSPHNRRLLTVRRLAAARERKRSGRFFAEGEDLIAAAQRAGREPVEGFRLAGSALGAEGFHDVEPATLRAVSALASGTRVIGIYEQRWSEVAGPLCVYLHGVGDPGNVGTVLRAAQAFGASSVALGPGCADPHSPKAVRASMGAIFAVTLARVDDARGLPGERIALSADADRPLRADVGAGARARGLTLLVGAEREGLPPAVLAACERVARIPIASESLNAAMAATVALYEITRQPDAPVSSRVRAA